MGRGISILTLIGNLIIEIAVILWDVKILLPQFREKKVKHVGIPYIIIGLFTMRAYAIGLSLLVRGILVLLDFIFRTKNTSPHHPVISEKKISKIIWYQETIRGIGDVLRYLIALLFGAGIFFKLHELFNTDNSIFLNIVNIILGIVGFILFQKYILEHVDNKKIRTIPPEKATLALIIGIFTIGANFGVLLLLWGLFILLYYEFTEKGSNALPDHDDIQDFRYILVATPNPHISEQFQQFNYSSEQKFDPKTGQPLDSFVFQQSNVKPRKKITQVLKTNLDQSKVLNTLKSKIHGDLGESNIKEDLEAYTILSPLQRRRLIALDIPEKEKNIIARSFLYLTGLQQNCYLEELEQVNTIDPIPQKFIQRINALPLPKKQHKLLTDQLLYLPPIQQQEFVEFLEESFK